MSEDQDYSIHYRRYHDTSPEHTQKMAEYFWSQISADIPENKEIRILDIGCGFGFALKALHNNGYENISGIDASPQQVDVARSLGLNVEHAVNTSDWLSALDDQFDVVLLLDVLEHVPPHEQSRFLKSIRKVLGTKGRLILTVPNASSFVASHMRFIDYTHTISFTEASLSYLLETSGFSKTVVRKQNFTRPSLRFWQEGWTTTFRFFMVRWMLRQIYKAEIPHEDIDSMTLDPNIYAVAT